jgi:hypothetical protein
MSTRLPASNVPLLFVALQLTGCATGAASTSTIDPGNRAPAHYAQSTDSATAGCLRNPACYTKLAGEEATIPWLSRAEDAAHAAITLARLLEDADIKLVEQTLTDCAQKANTKINAEDEELRGQEPTREQCKQVVRMEGDTDVTRAMDLGAKKHKEALDCVREALAERFTQNVSVEPTYQKDPGTGPWRWIDPKQVAEWLQLGLKSALWGALVPDIVIHASGNPNQIQRVYDFKFPCPADNRPSWRQYTRGQPHFPNHQGEMYRKALLGGKREANFSTPKGIK